MSKPSAITVNNIYSPRRTCEYSVGGFTSKFKGKWIKDLDRIFK